jgi:membrane associated rhomboid family serine protease
LIAIWFLQQLFNGIASLGAATSSTGGVAFWAHAGGFVSGAVLVWLFKDQESVERQRAAQATQPTSPQASGMDGRRPPLPKRGRRRGPA